MASICFNSTEGRRFRRRLQRLVERDPREPGREARFAAETVQMGEGAKIGLLHDILRLRILAEDAARNAVELAVVAFHDQAKAAPSCRRARSTRARSSRSSKSGVTRDPRLHGVSRIMPLDGEASKVPELIWIAFMFGERHRCCMISSIDGNACKAMSGSACARGFPPVS